MQAAAEFVVSPADTGARLDVFLTGRFSDRSRASVRRMIDAMAVRVDGLRGRAAQRVRAGQRVTVAAVARAPEGPVPEPIPLTILYEDAHLSVVDKPPGMVVHPAKGNWSGTLVNAMMYRYGRLSRGSDFARPGIVHRLDRDTSGVVVVARTDLAHAALAAQFAARSVAKYYVAIVLGVPDRDQDRIRRPIGMHPHQREKMAIRQGHSTSRDAETFFRVVERFDGFARLEIRPRTGRTHQIRVHLKSVGHPVLCDRLYGGRARITAAELQRRAGPRPDAHADDILLARQALHARRLDFIHPVTGQPLQIESPMPVDMQAVLATLRRGRQRVAHSGEDASAT